MTNVIYGLSRLALGETSLTPVIVERMYEERSGLFFPLARPETAGRRAVTWAALSPLALPDLPEAIGRRLVEEHLLDPLRFWLPVPPPSVSAADPSFSVEDRTIPGIRRYWRGPTWVNAAWLVWLGLVRLGYRSEAEELARRLAGAIRANGLHEYYEPYTGRGMGTTSFAWSALMIELVAPDPAAGESYLG
jgi:glycogen debranching enzyme